MKFLKIEKSHDDRIVSVVMNRPSIHNAFNDEMIEELINTFEILSSDLLLEVVVLTGEGKSFCAGADLNWMKHMKNYSKEENFQDSKRLQKLFTTINDSHMPVIGKINGTALGGGVGLVSVCDFCITHDKAKFGFTEVKLGLIPAVISPFVISKIGESHARARFLNGALFKSDVAQKIGLVHQVVEIESFESESSKLIESFLLAAPKAKREAKSLIKKVLESSGDVQSDLTCQMISQLRASEEGQEGMSALLEKRTPNWIKK